MRVGICIRGERADLELAQRLGFRAMEWMRFAESPAGPARADWTGFADEVAAEAGSRGLRISAIGAWYRNPFAPGQEEQARAAWHRAIEVAARLKIRTVCGFSGGIIETWTHERGGNPVYEPLEKFIPRMVPFWRGVADHAAAHGVRIAFENCPQGALRLPLMHYNLMSQPANWERFFDALARENAGLEWDPSHLLCQLIDPVGTIRRFGPRIFHVHAKDAALDRSAIDAYGICHPGVLEHRFPGLGAADWPGIVRALLLAGYDSDLNVEGFHDPVYRDHPFDAGGPLKGQRLEEAGLRIARETLEPLVRNTGTLEADGE
jgi:sugar phosphate isomerase/epimerase